MQAHKLSQDCKSTSIPWDDKFPSPLQPKSQANTLDMTTALSVKTWAENHPPSETRKPKARPQQSCIRKLITLPPKLKIQDQKQRSTHIYIPQLQTPQRQRPHSHRPQYTPRLLHNSRPRRRRRHRRPRRRPARGGCPGRVLPVGSIALIIR